MYRYGDPQVLVYEEVPCPTPGAGDVLVNVAAAGLNSIDHVTRAGYLQGMVDFALPFIPGLDLAGMVEAIGEGVSAIGVGDAVYGYATMLRQGAYAEYAVLGEHELAPKPSSMDFVHAAALPLASITAWQGLFDLGGLQAKQTVLIHGAGGRVGSLAV